MSLKSAFPWDKKSSANSPVDWREWIAHIDSAEKEFEEKDVVESIESAFTGVDMKDFFSEESPKDIIIEQKKEPLVNFPSRLFDELSGLPRSIFDFIQTSSMIKQPMLALPASLCAAGSIQGHRIRTLLDTRTNLYCLGLAPSGAGKDHARKVINRILYDSGLVKMVIGDPKSGSGLKRGIRDNGGRALLMWDEIGRALKQIGSWKAGNHEKNILEVMMKIFTTSSSFMPGDSLANRDNKNPAEGIDQPCFCLYGTSVPENFYEAMSGSDVVDGWLARMLVFESRDYIIMRRAKVDILETSQELKDEIKMWETMPTNIGIDGNVDSTIKPFTLAESAATRRALDDFDYDCRSKGFNTVYAPLWMRAAEHAEKIALIVSNGKELTEGNAKFGIDLSTYCIQYMQASISDRVSSSETEMQIKRIKRWIDKDGAWVNHRDLTRAFQDIPSRMRNELINTLIDSGAIETENDGKLKRYRGGNK